MVNKTHNGNVLRCKFNEPREGKLDGFSYLESLKNVKGDSIRVPFSKVVWSIRKRGKLALTGCLFKTILMSVINTRSLSHFFIFKESEKRLTMDSQPFSRFSPLSSKKYNIYLRELSRQGEYPKVYLFPP